MKHLLLGAWALTAFTVSHAAVLVDTGTPTGQVVGAYALDAADFYAGEIVISQATELSRVDFHVLGGSAGESFTVALYDDSAAHTPGTLLYSATASYGADGWNGAAGLAGWSVNAGHYWVAVEVGATDTLGSSSLTGALLDRGAPSALARTALNTGSGSYAATASALDFGVRVSAVPEPASVALLLAGLGVVGVSTARRRSTGR